MRTKIWKKRFVVFCLLVSVGIQITGCGEKAEESLGKSDNIAPGLAEQQNMEEREELTERYQEFDVALPDDVADVLAIREVEGKIWMIGDQKVYFSADEGETWETAAKETAALPQKCTAAAVSREGTMAFASGDGSITVRKSNQTQQSIEGFFTDDRTCYTLEFIDEGILLAADTGSNIQIIDMEKETVTGEVPAEGDYHYLMAPAGGEILTLTGEGVRYYEYQGKMQERNEVVHKLLSQDIADFNSIKGGVLAPDSEQKGFFYACSRGLFHYTFGGSITEQFIEGSSNSMGDHECAFYKMAALSDHTFFIVYRRGASEILLKKYAIAENSSESPDSGTSALNGEITIYTLNENRLLEQEINVINRNHQNCVMKIETGWTDENGMTVSDAMKTLNTEILAGNGPDILFLDGMSAEQYSESGLLLDLQDVLGEIAETEGIYKNIAYAYEVNGSVYAIPTRFQFPIMVGEENILSQITELDSLVNVIEALKAQHPEQTSLTGLYGEGLLESLFEFCAPSWIDNSGKIEADRLKQFLEAVKTIENIQSEGIKKEDIETVAGDFNYADDNEELYLPGNVIEGKQSMAFYLSKSLNFSRILLEQIEDTTYAFDGARGQSANVFLPKEIIAVNVKSDNQAAAVAFVKEFLSSSCQSTFQIEDTAYPVNKTAFERMEEAELQLAEETGIRMETCREGFEKIKSIIENLSVCSITDRTIREAVIEQGLCYLKGELTVEEAVGRIEQKVSIRMAE